MIGLVYGDKPLEQLADFCPYGWDGAVYQMPHDGAKLNVLGM